MPSQSPDSNTPDNTTPDNKPDDKPNDKPAENKPDDSQNDQPPTETPEKADPTTDPDSEPTTDPDDTSNDNDADDATDDNEPDAPDPDSLQAIRDDLAYEPGGLSEVDPADQQALEEAIPRNEDGTPQRYPDPFEGWAQLQNDGGNEVPGRSNNCADCSRSFLETWYGNPQVSAPRTLDPDENGNVDPWRPEDNANENQIRWTGAPHTYAGPGNDPDTAQRIANDLIQAGPGSAAIVQVDWPGGGGHAFNAVNHNGTIVWIDTQSGEVSTDPIHIENAEHAWTIPLDPNGDPLYPATPEPEAENNDQQNDADAQNQQDSQDPDPQDSQESQETQETQEPNQAQDEQNPQNDQSTPDTTQDDPADKSNDDSTPTDPNTEPTPDANPDPDTTPNKPDDSDPQTTTPDESTPDHTTPDESKPGEPKPDNATPDQPTPDQTKPDDPTPDEAKPNDPTPDEATPDQTKPDETKSDDPKPDDTKPNQSPPETKPDPEQNPAPETKPDPEQTPAPDSPPSQDTPHTTDPTPNNPTDTTDPANPADPTDPANPANSADPTHPNNPTDSTNPTDPNNPKPTQLNTDSTVPNRESLPQGKTADATRHIEDATQNKKPLYGDITPNNTLPQSTPNTRPEPTPPPGQPSEPGARRTPEEEAFVRRMVDFANESVENRKKYWRKDGQRLDLSDRVDGRELPQLKEDKDNPGQYIAASDAPTPQQPDYMPADIRPPVSRGRDEGITPEHLAQLDRDTNDREFTLAADRITEEAKQEAKKQYGEDSDEYKQAKKVYADTHSAVRDAGEAHGEYSALHHAMASTHPEYEMVEIPRTGNGSDQFDQIYEHKDKPGHFFVVEAKAPNGRLSPREGHSGQRVMQGTREYFETIIMEMENGSPKQQEYAEKLKRAYALGHVEYAVVHSKVETFDPGPDDPLPRPNTASPDGSDPGRAPTRYGGFSMEYFDIRNPQTRQP